MIEQINEKEETSLACVCVCVCVCVFMCSDKFLMQNTK